MYQSAFWITLSSVTAALAYASYCRGGSQEKPQGYDEHWKRFIIAFGLCATAEWAGGPGVHALYDSYGFTEEQTHQLYILGFFFSSIFGVFAGDLADRFGRKKSAMLFCVVGIIACIFKHIPDFNWLAVGRFFDGLHASLLYTCFETWLVSEHNQRHAFPASLLSQSFANMYFWNYVSAIVTGEVVQRARDMIPDTLVGSFALGGWRAPYELAAVIQLMAFVYIGLNWQENYGQGNAEGCCRGWKSFRKPAVWVAGLAVSAFESTMFIFIINWTPVLAPTGDKTQLPCGHIFTGFFMAAMSGASIFILIEKRFAKHTIVLGSLILAAVSMLVPVIFTVTEETKNLNFFAFILFELAVGIWFPASGNWKAEVVEEESRSFVYNAFRTPMNLIVIAVGLLLPKGTEVFKVTSFSCVFASVVLFCYIMSQPRSGARGEPLLAGA